MVGLVSSRLAHCRYANLWLGGFENESTTSDSRTTLRARLKSQALIRPKSQALIRPPEVRAHSLYGSGPGGRLAQIKEGELPQTTAEENRVTLRSLEAR